MNEYKNTCVACGSPCGYTGLMESADCSNPTCKFGEERPAAAAQSSYCTNDLPPEETKTPDKVKFLGTECLINVGNSSARTTVYVGQQEHIKIGLYHQQFESGSEWIVYVTGTQINSTWRGPDLKNIEDEVLTHFRQTRSEIDLLVQSTEKREDPETKSPLSNCWAMPPQNSTCGGSFTYDDARELALSVSGVMDVVQVLSSNPNEMMLSVRVERIQDRDSDRIRAELNNLFARQAPVHLKVRTALVSFPVSTSWDFPNDYTLDHNWYEDGEP